MGDPSSSHPIKNLEDLENAVEKNKIYKEKTNEEGEHHTAIYEVKETDVAAKGEREENPEELRSDYNKKNEEDKEESQEEAALEIEITGNLGENKFEEDKAGLHYEKMANLDLEEKVDTIVTSENQDKIFSPETNVTKIAKTSSEEKNIEEQSFISSTSQVINELFKVDTLKSIESSQFKQPIFKNLFSDRDLLQSRLVNYLMIAADFSAQNEIRINENFESSSKLDWKARGLMVDENKIMLTGGKLSRQVLIINIAEFEIESHSKLKQARELHAMAWLDNNPAVIGGYDGENPLNTVEFLVEKEWRNAESINHKRYGLSACNILHSVWIAGGCSSKNDGVVEIEVYSNGYWRDANVKLPTSLVGIGLFSKGTTIFMIGGMNEYGENTKEVLAFDTVAEKYSKQKEIDEACSFTQNIWKLNRHNELEGVAFRGNLVTYIFAQ